VFGTPTGPGGCSPGSPKHRYWSVTTLCTTAEAIGQPSKGPPATFTDLSGAAAAAGTGGAFAAVDGEQADNSKASAAAPPIDR